jgi:uncharacterized membrane protein (UPF0127 family)
MTVLGMMGGALAQVAPPWRQQVAPLETREILVGGVPLTVELAYQPPDMARGLSYREELAPGTGMLFLYLEPGYHNFHMRGMRFCLDFAWIEGGVIAGVTEDVCPTAADTPPEAQPTYRSPVPVTYVLEIPAGWLDAYGLGIGTPVEGLPTLVVRKDPETP